MVMVENTLNYVIDFNLYYIITRGRCTKVPDSARFRQTRSAFQSCCDLAPLRGRVK